MSVGLVWLHFSVELTPRQYAMRGGKKRQTLIGLLGIESLYIGTGNKIDTDSLPGMNKRWLSRCKMFHFRRVIRMNALTFCRFRLKRERTTKGKKRMPPKLCVGGSKSVNGQSWNYFETFGLTWSNGTSPMDRVCLSLSYTSRPDTRSAWYYWNPIRYFNPS